MEKMVLVEPEKCTGCRICEMICSFQNSNGNTFNPYQSNIKIIKTEERGVDLPVLCLHCQDPLCVDICPMGAIKRTMEGIVKIDQNSCRGCKACLIVCPYGAINVVNGKMKKCELCDGDPMCVKWCPTDAIMTTKSGSSEIPRSKKMIESLIRLVVDGREK